MFSPDHESSADIYALQTFFHLFKNLHWLPSWRWGKWAPSARKQGKDCGPTAVGGRDSNTLILDTNQKEKIIYTRVHVNFEVICLVRPEEIDSIIGLRRVHDKNERCVQHGGQAIAKHECGAFLCKECLRPDTCFRCNRPFVRKKVDKVDPWVRKQMDKARGYEKAMNFGRAIEIYEDLEMWDDAARCRKKADEGEETFTCCPYCGRDLNLPRTPKYCPYCKEELRQ